jgi:hypothetical protein
MRTVPYTLAAILLATPLAGQDYRWERDETLGIQFRVHKKLTRATAPYAGLIPHYRYWYDVTDVGDLIHTKYGAFTWYIFVLEFPKDLTGVPESRLRGRNFREWVERRDPNLNNREILVDNREKKARRNQLAHRWWEFRDSLVVKRTVQGYIRGSGTTQEQFDQPLHYVAAVYDQPERQIAVVGIIPIKDYRTLKPDPRFMGYLTNMVTSLQFIEITAAVANNVRDRTLRQAQTFADSTSGWGHLPGENYAVLYSWDPEKDSKKRDSERFAAKMLQGLERVRELYAQELPAHPKQAEYFPVVRVSHDYESFLHQAGTSEQGTVAEFNPGSKQVDVYFDKGREWARNERELLGAAFGAGWRQYASFYFHVETDVDLHRWYEIGLAAWFSSHSVSGSRVRYRPDPARIRAIRTAVQNQNYLDLEEFLTLTSDDFDSQAEEHEAQAYALVDFLKRGAEEADGFDPAWSGILERYRSSALDNRSPRRALAAAIEGVDLVALEAIWVEWVKAGLK